MDTHGEDGFILFELKYHFIKEAQNSELIHILNVKVDLLEVLLIQDELIFVEAQDVLRWKNNFGEGRFETDYPVTGDLNVLFVHSEKKARLLASEIGYFEEIDFRVGIGVVNAAPLFFGFLLERLFGDIFYERCCNSH